MAHLRLLPDEADSLKACRNDLDRLLGQRRICGFNEDQQRHYSRLCAVETMFLGAHRGIVASVARSAGD